ncbi:MAG: DUF1552 domain-containing protein [Planctomycetes bacterium]|nr:DUF1552 domain-containing protein [Planctomycetota bacterium]
MTGTYLQTRRQILRDLRDLGVSALALPFLSGLPSLYGDTIPTLRKQRLVLVFSPNGTVPSRFWPDQTGKGFECTPILKPLEPYRERMLIMKGISNKIRGDGDSHMRGMSCLLTADELFPGNIQGGSHTPAGWAKGISIDQELKRFLQSREETRTRFGSLEFGVAVPDRADPWTRMCYAGPNKPLAPISDPEQILSKLYGDTKNRENLASIVDGVKEDLRRVAKRLSPEDKAVLEDHLALVRDMERELAAAAGQEELEHPMPEIDPDIELVNDNTPRISRMQIDLLVNAMANDMTRIASLQFMRSVGQARMNWLGVEEGHHTLSHEPDKNEAAQEKLQKINAWFAGELAYLVKRLAETPEPGTGETMLDNTLVIWLNELGKGSSHTLNDIPFLAIGGAPGFRMGRSLDFSRKEERENGEMKVVGRVPHNRLWLAVAKSMGHELETFGLQSLCDGGALDFG